MSDELSKFAAFCRRLVSAIGFIASAAVAVLIAFHMEMVVPGGHDLQKEWYSVALSVASIAIGPYVISALFMLNVDLHVFELSRVPLATSYRAAILFSTIVTLPALYFNVQAFVIGTGLFNFLS